MLDGRAPEGKRMKIGWSIDRPLGRNGGYEAGVEAG